MCIDLYGPDPADFIPAPELVWKSALKNTKVNQID